ncbi:MAG: endonuclease/exonuclease/phosphatase family protein [Sumerlaeia bacterium]
MIPRLLSTLLLTLFLAVAATAPSAPTSTADEPASRTLTVMTYNIRVGLGLGGSWSGHDPKENLLSIAELILDSGADIVLLQEVDTGARRTNEVDEPALLAEGTGFHAAFSPALQRDGGHYGIAILSRWPLEVQTVQLFKPDYSGKPDLPDWYAEQRVAQVATVQAPGGPLTVINTHLGVTKDQRLPQLTQIATLVDRAPHPVILGGDLNAEPDAEELLPLRNRLADAYHDMGQGRAGLPADLPIAERLTFPADDPNRCIDYLFYAQSAFQPIKTEVIAEKSLSDHRPVLAVFERTSPPTAP